MAFPVMSHLSFSKLLILANALFWILFAIFFVATTYPHRPHRQKFEEVVPEYIFFGRALPQLDTGTGVGLPPSLINFAFAIQRPSVLAARPFYQPFNSRGITVDRVYAGISVGGYYLLLVCLLSFMQWYVVGALLDIARKRFARKPTPAAER